MVVRTLGDLFVGLRALPRNKYFRLCKQKKVRSVRDCSVNGLGAKGAGDDVVEVTPRRLHRLRLRRRGRLRLHRVRP